MGRENIYSPIDDVREAEHIDSLIWLADGSEPDKEVEQVRRERLVESCEGTALGRDWYRLSQDGKRRLAGRRTRTEEYGDNYDSK